MVSDNKISTTGL